MTEWVESCGDSDTVRLVCGVRKKKGKGWGRWSEEGDARKRGGKRTDRGRDTRPVCLMFGFPGVFRAVKQHADSLLVLSDENNTSL